MLKRMSDGIKQFLTSKGPWPLVVLVVAGLISFTLIAIFAPADTRTALFGAHGALFTLLGWLVSSPLSGGSAPPPPPPGQ